MSRALAFRVISIGTLPAHPLWNERTPVRTGHATTTLIRSGDAVVLVDPGLPAPALVARLHERACLAPTDITHVFLTTFQPDTTRGLHAFDHATWLVHPDAREGIGAPLAMHAKRALEAGDQDVAEIIGREIATLQRCHAVEEAIAPGIDIFPLPGVSPGCCGLLLAEPWQTTLLCGDAVPTVEHLEAGKVLPRSADIAKAKESFAEAVEIADMLILGRDNIVANPLRYNAMSAAAPPLE